MLKNVSTHSYSVMLKNHSNLFLVLEEQNEELHAMVLNKGVEEGRHLLNGTSNSLAYELGEMNNREVIIYDTFFNQVILHESND